MLTTILSSRLYHTCSRSQPLRLNPSPRGSSASRDSRACRTSLEALLKTVEISARRVLRGGPRAVFPPACSPGAAPPGMASARRLPREALLRGYMPGGFLHRVLPAMAHLYPAFMGSPDLNRLEVLLQGYTPVIPRVHSPRQKTYLNGIGAAAPLWLSGSVCKKRNSHETLFLILPVLRRLWLVAETIVAQVFADDAGLQGQIHNQKPGDAA